jgi:hypothetical protein
MKRREERELRTQLAAAESHTAAASGASTQDVDSEPVASGPLIVVEGGTGASALGAGRSGRRSFGQFNSALERDFAIAVKQTLPEAPEAEEKLQRDSAAQYQRWKLKNVSGAISGTKLGKGIDKASTAAMWKQRQKRASVLRASLQAGAQTKSALEQSALLSPNANSDSGAEDGEIPEEIDLSAGDAELPVEKRATHAAKLRHAPALTRAETERTIERQLPIRQPTGSTDDKESRRPFKKPKL